jgi:hypothetical protein
MRKLMNDHAVLVLVTVGLAVAAVAAPTLAGTVYSWTTEDGTAAYTDDPKRIPAKYKKQVEKRQLGKLKNYKRFTESQVKQDTPYEQRVNDRLGALREGPPAVSAAPPGREGGVRYGVGIGAPDNDQISFPVGEASDEPFVTSEHRIRTRNSIATQDVQVTKQGDKVISVRISAPNQRSVSERVEY